MTGGVVAEFVRIRTPTREPLKSHGSKSDFLCQVFVVAFRSAKVRLETLKWSFDFVHAQTS